jgi:hypothetical protein
MQATPSECRRAHSAPLLYSAVAQRSAVFHFRGAAVLRSGAAVRGPPLSRHCCPPSGAVVRGLPLSRRRCPPLWRSGPQSSRLLGGAHCTLRRALLPRSSASRRCSPPRGPWSAVRGLPLRAAAVLRSVAAAAVLRFAPLRSSAVATRCAAFRFAPLLSSALAPGRALPLHAAAVLRCGDAAAVVRFRGAAVLRSGAAILGFPRCSAVRRCTPPCAAAAGRGWAGLRHTAPDLRRVCADLFRHKAGVPLIGARCAIAATMSLLTKLCRY